MVCRRRKLLIASAIVCCVVLCLSLGRLAGTSPSQLLDRARVKQKGGEFVEAERLALQAFELDRQLEKAAYVAGQSAAGQADWSRALEHFGRINPIDQRLRLALRLNEADLLDHQLHSLAKAEDAYRSALRIDASNKDANEGLAKLLSLCARTREATPFILRLIQENDNTELVLLLSRPDMTVGETTSLMQAQHADATDPNPYVGLAWHALQGEQYASAERLLESALRLDPQNVSARVLLGRLYLVTSRSTEFSLWSKSLSRAAEDVADVWLIRGQMAEAVGDVSGAIRCYWEALRKAPESKQATFRLDYCLAKAGDDGHPETLRQRVHAMQTLEEMQNRALFSSGGKRPELFLPLAQAYEAAGRLWEAYGWCRRAMTVGTPSTELASMMSRLKQRLQHEPLQLVTDSANVVKTMDLSGYPLPDLRPPSEATPIDIATSQMTPIFRDDAKTCGVSFRYFNGVKGPPTQRMFEFTGGGIGVLDFDLDALPDLFFTQGCTWPRGAPDVSRGDRLFRNRGAIQFEDVSTAAQITENGFGQGIAIGDFNSDGLPDVYVANIGRNTFWQNQGDGTFLDISSSSGVISEDWTTSTILVDLTGDGLPDIYDVNYAGDVDAFDRVCRYPDGAAGLCKPSDFRGQADRLWKNLGDGRFQDITKEWLGEIPLGMGLGVAAWDADGSGQLSLFVANDTTPNFFFQRVAINGNEVQLRDRAIDAGLAFNGAGKATGCMGVALGHIGDDQRMALVITNFYGESNTLFVSAGQGFFDDESRQRGLEGPSVNMLGFGTQFLDVDLDGRLELFVANGHVDDLRRYSRPYRMSPQLFQLDERGRFTEQPRERLGPYFAGNWLGRSVVRVDWNCDGSDDLVVGHLHDPSAILTNLTPPAGSHLSLRLIGVDSNRDAIGTRVEARVGARKSIHQLTAGDGYQCSNERRVRIGTGNVSQIDELEVRWPSGLVQQFANIHVPAELCIREGHAPIADPSVR